MHKLFSPVVKQEVINISPGEYYTSTKGEIICTVLGSCISVAFFDPVHVIGGMNHFMLPEDSRFESSFYKTRSGRYGMHAMELLLNQMFKLGAAKQFLQAKIFGGGNVLIKQTDTNSVAQKNIDFALKYLNFEEIKIISRDVGGILSRKIFFFTSSGRVILKKLSEMSST